MPRNSIHRLSQQILERASADVSERRVQLRVDFRMSMRCPACAREVPDAAEACLRCGRAITEWKWGPLLGSLGGEWDLDERCFVGPGTKARVWGISELQRESVVYWLAWMRAYITADWGPFEAAYGPRPFSMWTYGGRRRGKTHFGIRALPGFTIACPEAFPSWLIAPIEDDFDEGKELHREWVKAVPVSWYEWNRREMYIQMVHGPRVMMLSAHEAEKLKQGGFGYAFWNEAQKSKAALRGFNNLRGGAADSGTLVHVAANPAREAHEYWVEDLFEKLDRGEVVGKLFNYEGDNANVNEASLDSMATEMSARDYEIERGGARLARPHIVMYEFRDGKDGNVQPAPRRGEITEDFLRRKLGRPFAALAQMDFQMLPHQVALVDRFYDDPVDSLDAFSWTVHEVVLEQATEGDLVDGLEGLGYRGQDTLQCLSCGEERPGVVASVTACGYCKASWASGQGVRQILATAIVADATGDYQQADRKQGRITGRGSYDLLRARGWRHIFTPDPDQARNPHVSDRTGVGNARLRDGDKRRRAFVVPECKLTIEALKKWPNNAHGKASRVSEYAHIGDAWTYGKYRLWPKRFVPKSKPRPPLIINIHGRDDRAG